MEKQAKTQRALGPESGAALITVLLMATLLLMAGAALIVVTSSSAVNAADATSESQAYYAAEAGMQGVLGALRGNNAPSQLFNVDPANAANKISFRKAVTPSQSNVSGDAAAFARLSRWLPYNGTSLGAVVPINPNYTAQTGMAYTVEEIKDVDNTDTVIFSTQAAFDGGTPSSSAVTKTVGTVGPGNSSDNFTLSYTPAPATNLSAVATVSSSLGTFEVTNVNGSGATIPSPITFTLVVKQTGPWVSTKIISGTITGSVTKAGSTTTVALRFNLPTDLSSTTMSLEGATYSLTDAIPAPSVTPIQYMVPVAATSVPVRVSVTAPEPERLRIRVTGYGPRNAVKKMQMLVSRFAFDYNASGAITLRSHDDNSTVMHIDIGSSSVYVYNGNDNSNGPALPAFTVTGDQDVTYLNGLPSGQVLGSSPAARKVPITSLDSFLQTTGGARGARAALDQLRSAAKNQRTPGCVGTSAACDRYFASGESPSNIGAGTDGMMTFVDGDYSMPPSGGAGLLVVTGTLTMTGNASFNGLILVLGGGNVQRNGGGGDLSLGAIAVARFGATGDFLEPTFNVSGGGNSTIRFDSEWVKKALKSAGPGVLGVSEYGP